MTITASFGILSAVVGTPRVVEIFAFAGGAVLAFSLVEAFVSGGFRPGLSDEPSEVRALGGSISVFPVGLSLAAALASGSLVGGFAAWSLGSFLATLAYLLPFAFEINLATGSAAGQQFGQP